MRPAALGTATGLALGGAVALASRGPTLVPWPARVRTAFPYALGAVAGLATGVKVGALASTIDALRGHGRGPLPSARVLAVGAVAVGAGAVAASYGRDLVLTRMADGGRALDGGFSSPADDPCVSGSAASLVPQAALGREGARFCGTKTTADDVREVTGAVRTVEPVRVYVGVEAAPSVEARVDLAMAELRRTGAFDRGSLLVIAPAGSGYANATPVDVLEILTGGDCAAVSIGYGLLPSFMSLGKVQVAARTQSLLLAAIVDELRDRPKRPTLLLYGESLGAEVQQTAIPAGPIDLDALGVTHALYVGTPGGRRSDTFHALCAAESVTVDRPEQVPPVRPRTWFLEHDGDPVVRFRPEVATQCPAWLEPGVPRGRNIPASMRWVPGITWAQVLVDTLFATNIKPGDFQSLGHDYRADLGAVVTAAFDLPTSPAIAERLEVRLRAIEVERARRIAG